MAIQSDYRWQGQWHNDNQRNKQRAAAADTQQAGIGQWVTKQPLHHGTRHRQRTAYHHCQQYARQADVQPDMPGGVAEGLLPQGAKRQR
ncbi:hypothetical protein D3C72_2279090 [compost metagenome]